MEWYEGQKVILDKKKENGYPNGREVGDILKVKSVMSNPKCVRLVIEGNKMPGDTFTLHESYVIPYSEYRERQIDKILSDTEENKERELVC